MKKVLYFCDFCEIIRPKMSDDSSIKKYQSSTKTFVEDSVAIEIKASQVKVFYPLILRARSYVSEDRKRYAEITQTKATRLKSGEEAVPNDYIPLQSECNQSIRLAEVFFNANIVPNLKGGTLKTAVDEIIALIESNCSKNKLAELKKALKDNGEAGFLAAVFISAISNNRKEREKSKSKFDVTTEILGGLSDNINKPTTKRNFNISDNAKKIMVCVCFFADSKDRGAEFQLIENLSTLSESDCRKAITELSEIGFIKETDSGVIQILIDTDEFVALVKQQKLKSDDFEGTLSKLIDIIKHNEANKWSNAKEFAKIVNPFENDTNPLVLELLCELAFLCSWNDESTKCGKYLSEFWVTYNSLHPEIQSKPEYVKAYYKFCDALQDDLFTNEWFLFCKYYNDKCIEIIKENSGLIVSSDDSILKIAIHLINKADALGFSADYLSSFPAHFYATETVQSINDVQRERYQESIRIANEALHLLETEWTGKDSNDNGEFTLCFYVADNEDLQKCEKHNRIDKNCEYCAIKTRALKAKAYAYNGMGQVQEALLYAKEAKKCCKRKDDKHDMKSNPDTLRIKDLIGLILMTDKSTEAPQEFVDSYGFFKTAAKTQSVAISRFRNLHAFALSWFYSGNLSESIKRGNEAVEHIINTKIDPPRKAVCHYNLAMAYVQNNNPEFALKHLTVAKDIFNAYRNWQDDIASEFNIPMAEAWVQFSDFEWFINLCDEKINDLIPDTVETAAEDRVTNSSTTANFTNQTLAQVAITQNNVSGTNIGAAYGLTINNKADP